METLEFTIGKDKHIQYVIAHFDFDKVHKIMKTLNWTWCQISINPPYYSYYTPTEDDLIECATKLLNDVYDFNCNYTETGGFRAKKQDDCLELEFILEEESSLIMNLDTPNYGKLKKLKERENKLNTINKLLKNEND